MTDTYDDETRKFGHFLHNLAKQIGERPESGAPRKEQVIAAANDDLMGLCQRYLDPYGRRECGGQLDRLTLPLVVRVAHRMVHQRGFDTGQAVTFRQIWKRDEEHLRCATCGEA